MKLSILTLVLSVFSFGVKAQVPTFEELQNAFKDLKAYKQVLLDKGFTMRYNEPLPEYPELFCVTHAFWQYAKGIAHAVLGNIDDALKQQSLLREAVAAIPDDRIVFQNESRDILSVAGPMLAGELEYRRRNYDIAVVTTCY